MILKIIYMFLVGAVTIHVEGFFIEKFIKDKSVLKKFIIPP